MKTEVAQKLQEEAQVLHPIIEKYYQSFLRGEVFSYDLAGIYILLYISLRKKKNWSNGALPEPIIANESDYVSIRLEEVPDVLEIVSKEFLQKRLKILGDSFNLRVVDLFNRLNLIGLKNNSDLHVNRCIVMWALGNRPIKLLSYVPTPMEVLNQQANGERVVTLFHTEDDLGRFHTSQLTYMAGNQEHPRDPLEFLTHDFKHMEHFVDPVTHYEQKGFFRSFLNINNGKVKSFFLNDLEHNKLLWNELEYVISDMNCFSTHLLRYLFAKLLISCRKRLDETEQKGNEEILLERVTQEWYRILIAFGMHEQCLHDDCPFRKETISCLSAPAFTACMRLVLGSFKKAAELSVEEWTMIRDYFEHVGKLADPSVLRVSSH